MNEGQEAAAYPGQAAIFGAEESFAWIDSDFLRQDPFAFPKGTFKQFVLACAREFDVDPNGVFCLGSGAIGLSLNPGKIQGDSLKAFDEGSDLDIALISEVHFETAWRDLRDASHPARGPMEPGLGRNIDWQRKRFFDGAIIVSKLLPFVSFGPDWIGGKSRITGLAEDLLGRPVEVNFWLYRDYWSVRSYVATGIHKCKQELV